ncbi:MAG: MarC family protein [Methanomassiliicoccales archaeon]|nr:MarC family protein [Methanomassiliicoccales archaeon]
MLPRSMVSFDELIYATTLLFFIFDPFATVPLFITLTRGQSEEEQAASANKAVLVAGILFVIFALIGAELLHMFSITTDAFRIAGGIVLLLMAMEIIFSLRLSKSEDTSVAWVIIATPLLSGPGVITTAILLVHLYGQFTVLIAGVIGLSVTWGIMRNSMLISQKVGNNAIEIFSKIIGLLLAAIAVEFIMRGAVDYVIANLNLVFLLPLV